MHKKLKNPLFYGLICAMFMTLAFNVEGSTQTAFGVDAPAPYFEVIDNKGKTHHLSDYKGKVVVLEWTSDACPYSNKRYAAKEIQSLQEKYKDVVWLTISSTGHDEPGFLNADSADKFITNRRAAPTALLLDHAGIVGKIYNARVTPYSVVINREGVVAYSGAVDSNLSPSWSKREAKYYLKDAIEKVINGELPNPKITHAYGCTIKYATN